MKHLSAGIILGLLSALTLAHSAKAEFVMGDWVLSRYQGGNYYYPGIVSKNENGRVTTKYLDGDIDTQPSNNVKIYGWDVDSRVECNYRGGGTWYAGTIGAMQGLIGLSINYDDGDFEETIAASCRSR